jgi:hypothetical protein
MSKMKETEDKIRETDGMVLALQEVVVHPILCTRYNAETWSQNMEWRRRNKSPCVYGSPREISPVITMHAWVFVIEMNNDLNRVMGVGLMRNVPRAPLRKRGSGGGKVYSENYYNRCVYSGVARIDREDVAALDDTAASVFAVLDRLLFKGYRHCKRGSGITQFPRWIQEIMVQRRQPFHLALYFRDLFKKFGGEGCVAAVG